jgi:putative tricarboxylic transport membrane protein
LKGQYLKKEASMVLRDMKKLGMVCFVIGLAVLVASLACPSARAQVQKPKGFPSKNMEYVIGWGAGGGSDVFGRLICIPVRRPLGVSLVVVNMPGGAAAAATEYVMNQPADGHTLFGITNDLDVNSLLGRSKYTPHKDMIPIIRAHVDVSAIVFGEKSPGKNWQELVAYGKKNPGKLTMGGIGALASDERWGKMVWEAAGVQISYVPYDDAGEMHAALLGGHINTMFEEPGVIMSMIEKGSMKPAIILTEKRVPKFADVPCAGEVGVVPPMMWRGVGVKKGTPNDVVKFLEAVFTQALKDEMVKHFEKSRLLDLYPGYMGSADFMKVWEQEYQVNEKSLKTMGLIK